jgi:hypothetical protein
MTQEDKLERAAEILREYYVANAPGAAEAIVNALTETEEGIWGKFWDDDEDRCIYGKLLDKDYTVYQYYSMGGCFKNFRPIPGLKEVIEEAEK